MIKKLPRPEPIHRAGGNVTGVTQANLEIAPKRLELLHELLPAARIMTLPVDWSNPAVAETAANQMRAAARPLGRELHVLNASTESDFGAVFARINQLRASGLVISAGTAFFVSRSGQLAALAARHAVPSVSAGRALVMAEGLISYGADIFDAYRLTGPLPNRVLGLSASCSGARSFPGWECGPVRIIGGGLRAAGRGLPGGSRAPAIGGGEAESRRRCG